MNLYISSNFTAKIVRSVQIIPFESITSTKICTPLDWIAQFTHNLCALQ